MHARRYVDWVKQHAIAIIAGYLVLFGIASWLIATRLPLRADFSYLLPQDAPAVRDLHVLEARLKASDGALVVVQAPSSEERAVVVAELGERLRRLPPTLVEDVITSREDVRQFLEHRQYLFATVGELEQARDALQDRIGKANPLFVPLYDAPKSDQLGALRARRDEARQQLAALSQVSADGKTAIIELRTPFRGTDAAHGKQLLAELTQARAATIAAHPAVDVGFAGGIVTGVAEHDAIVRGMLLSSVVTGVLVMLVLALYFRSLRLLAHLVATISLATVLAFGIAAVTVGHLNAATAFLGAIIAGNGVNYGILLVARYAEERRSHGVEDALARAIAATSKPTAIASLAAAIAYGALAASSFRGFADFAVIGAVGMIVVWLVSFSLLPALLVRWSRYARVGARDPAIGRVLSRALGIRNARAMLAAFCALTIVAGAVAVRFVAADPFEYDIKQLRSRGSEAVTARHWMTVTNKTFGSGLIGRTVIAADRANQVPRIVDALRAIDAGKPEAARTIGDIWSIGRFVPADQPRKLAVIAEIRALFDRIHDPELAELRPPDDLRPFAIADLPASLRERFTERDGRVGTLIEVRPAPNLSEWNGKDLIRFASAIRELDLPGGERITNSGTSVIFADILEAIAHDGPVVTLLAAAGLIVLVVLLVGANRRAVAVLASTAVGSLIMVATCAVLGIRVTFLDFVALPITLGLGIDYSINIAHRHRGDVRETLRTSGGAVAVCSATTVIGYASLLVSDNLAIRDFGLASLIGEIACVLAALALVPALLDATFRKPRRRFQTLTVSQPPAR